MAGDTYDRELIARMLEALKESPTMRFVTTAVDDQIRLLRDADNREAAGVQTVRLGGDENEWVPIEHDAQYERDYIPMPGGWEIQTKGKGSTYRICGPDDERLAIPSSPYLHDTLTQMARDVNAAWAKLAAPTPEDGRGDAIPRSIVRDAVVEAILDHPADAMVDVPDFVDDVMERIDHALAQAERQGEG